MKVSSVPEEFLQISIVLIQRNSVAEFRPFSTLHDDLVVPGTAHLGKVPLTPQLPLGVSAMPISIHTVRKRVGAWRKAQRNTVLRNGLCQLAYQV